MSVISTVRNQLHEPVAIPARFDGFNFKAEQRRARLWARNALKGSYTNTDTGWIIQIDHGGIQKATSAAGSLHDLNLLQGLPHLLETSIWMGNSSLRDDKQTYPWTHDRSHSQASFVLHTFYGVALYNGKRFQVRIVIREQTNGECFYEEHTAEAEQAELGIEPERLRGGSAPETADRFLHDLLPHSPHHRPCTLDLVDPLHDIKLKSSLVVDAGALFATPSSHSLMAGVPEGYDALILADLVVSMERDVLHVAADDIRLARLVETVRFFAPAVTILEFPAWNTVPYDRASPHREILSRRADVLSRLADRPAKRRRGETPCLVATTVGALLQRVPRVEIFRSLYFLAKVGVPLQISALIRFLEHNGYHQREQVMEPSEYAVRGGIIDVFPPGTPEPLRLNVFDDELEALRSFDPMSQRTTGQLSTFTLRPASEVLLNEATIARFCNHYRALFGIMSHADPLYESISAGRRFHGMEHWLPLFYDSLDTLFAYLPTAVVTLDSQAEKARQVHFNLMLEYFEARRTCIATGVATTAEASIIYNPVPPSLLFIAQEEWVQLLSSRVVATLSPYPPASESLCTRREEGSLGAAAFDAGGRLGEKFSAIHVHPELNIFEALRKRVAGEQAAGRRVIVTALSTGARDRLSTVMREHGIAALHFVDSWPEVVVMPVTTLAVAVLGLETGFTAPCVTVISEQDILGERVAQPLVCRRRQTDYFIADALTLMEGDLVVHIDHGIGQYNGLATLSVGGAPHDCLCILYESNEKLFVPVENIEVLSRYGSETADVQRDRLGGIAWQARKVRLQQRIQDMAEQLIRLAAERQIKQVETVVPPEKLYDEFCARFPYVETTDQLSAITDVMADLASGRPMDRLVCGDVGFGKTEVALRAAFTVALSGMQVAVVVPTTLLARQHYTTFTSRSSGLPLRIESLSRLVASKQAVAVRQGLADGTIDIVIGTHALLASRITFKRLGLLVVDEEQHFGVSHKERLKQLKANVHVLTLTATPIPRTLQLALSGVREMSLIATPPVDRLAVRTFVLPFDLVVIREAILRERFRGGQTFYVCPRVADIKQVAEWLIKVVPEVKVSIAHGRLSSATLEEQMSAFTNRVFDVLICTNIIESGLDMPLVNTIIVHRADLFGLAQLYQLRGRVGRGKVCAYAYLTVPSDRTLTQMAEKRLAVMQTLDTLGAGFTLASHDLDIRGAGNLLGQEQSGHIREVGIELYQQMLEKAVVAARSGNGSPVEQKWSPQITLGTPVLIPESYVPELGLRLNLYQRIARLLEQAEIEAFAIEMTDRFGPLPKAVDNLLKAVALKGLCRQANVNRLEVGPKGAVLTFRDNQFPKPIGLMAFATQQTGRVKLRPDHRMVIMHGWEDPEVRMIGVWELMETIAKIATQGESV